MCAIYLQNLDRADTMVLAEPLRVSPLIKVNRCSPQHFQRILTQYIFQTCRWTALIAGIWWGGKRWHANKAAEDEVGLKQFVIVLY